MLIVEGLLSVPFAHITIMHSSTCSVVGMTVWNGLPLVLLILPRTLSLSDTFSIINASIIQGSVIGLSSNVVAASDKHVKRPSNSMMKYADESYLPVGSKQISTVPEEFALRRGISPGSS